MYLITKCLYVTVGWCAFRLAHGKELVAHPTIASAKYMYNVQMTALTISGMCGLWLASSPPTHGRRQSGFMH